MDQPDSIAFAVAHPDRPADDRQRDSDRKPAEVLAFFGVEPGMKVADLMTGRGYYAELLGHVVGSNGVVFAHNNRFVLDRFAAEPLGKRLEKASLSHVKLWDRELDDLGFEPGSLDGAMMVLFYHDTIWQKVDRPAMNESIFAAIRSGGFFGVIDHVAKPSQGDVSKSLHRIDPEQIKREVLGAGFVLEAESPLLRHPEDDHTINVFDDSIRGKTDRVVYRFRKP